MASAAVRAFATAAASSAAAAAPAVRRGHKVSIVLRRQLDNLGHAGELVTVAPGYARNFLVPSGAAVYATPSAIATHRVVLPDEESRAIAAQREVNMLKARIASVRLQFNRATVDGVALYGSVTPADIVESLQGSVLKKLAIRDRHVRFMTEDGAVADERALKSTGVHTVQIEPRAGLWCPLQVVIEST